MWAKNIFSVIFSHQAIPMPDQLIVNMSIRFPYNNTGCTFTFFSEILFNPTFDLWPFCLPFHSLKKHQPSFEWVGQLYYMHHLQVYESYNKQIISLPKTNDTDWLWLPLLSRQLLASSIVNRRTRESSKVVEDPLATGQTAGCTLPALFSPPSVSWGTYTCKWISPLTQGSTLSTDAHCFVVWLIQIQAWGRLVLRIYKIKPCGIGTIKNSMGINGRVFQRLRTVAKLCYCIKTVSPCRHKGPDALN